MWALLEVQKQQPIMFPYPYLQSSPKMQAKAKAQLFVFLKILTFFVTHLPGVAENIL